MNYIRTGEESRLGFHNERKLEEHMRRKETRISLAYAEKTHAAEESQLGSLATDYEESDKGEPRMQEESHGQKKPPHFQWGVSCWHWQSISLAVTIKQVIKDWRPTKMLWSLG